MITDKKINELSAKMLELMSEAETVGQFLDALTLAQSSVISQASTYKHIREIASEIRDKIIANATFIKERNEEN